MAKSLLLNPADNVAILTEMALGGTDPLALGTPLANIVPPGHKVSRTDMKTGDAIRKFGQIIGYATQDIPAGTHVHSHNCEFGAHERDYKVGADLEHARAAIPKLEGRSFMGYQRPDGRVGTRNMIALCATVNCSATVIQRAADTIMRSGVLDDYPNIDGIAAFSHGTGCGMPDNGPGWDNLQRVLWGYATHPNVGATVFVGLGCETMQIDRMRELFGSDGSDGSERFHGLTIQASGGTSATVDNIVQQVHELLPQVNKAKRQPCPASALTVALQCGGSDGFSGISANPSLGATANQIVGLGGTVILSETPEIYGAEQLLLQRAVSDEVAQKLLDKISWWEHYTSINNASMDNNPSPGNKAGGLTTILEKSLGAAAKAGSTPLMDVVAYAERVTSKGFVFMDSPGYDPVSVTGQIASGAQIVMFTTGRGSAFGSKPAPTLKLATNDTLFQAMPDDMDINCGDVISHDVAIADKADEIVNMILETASGKPSKSEILGLGDHEFCPWQIGVVM